MARRAVIKKATQNKCVSNWLSVIRTITMCKNIEAQFQISVEKYIKKLSKRVNGIKIGGILITLSNRMCSTTMLKYLKYVVENQLLSSYATPTIKSSADSRLYRFFNTYSDAIKIVNSCREWITACNSYY